MSARSYAIGLLTLSLSGCTCSPESAPPGGSQITLVPILPSDWSTGSTLKVLTAKVTLSEGGQLPADYHVFARLRHAPSPDQAAIPFLPAIEASPVPESPGTYGAVVPSPGDFLSTQLIDVMWVIDWHFPDGSVSEVKSSPTEQFQVGCSPGASTAFLDSEQASMLARFPRGGMGLSVIEIAAAGFVFPTHGWASTSGMGVAALNPAAPSTPTAGQPEMAFFLPSDRTKNVLDQLEDGPYDLIGFGYAVDFNPAMRPTLSCVPYQEWFVHEAGYHLANGGFSPTSPPGETTPGSMPAIEPFPPQLNWHDRVWDLHLWLNPTGPTPTLGITAPMQVPGLVAPPESFFYVPMAP